MRSAPRFQSHVAFGNLDSVETTKNNTIGITLQTRHKAYRLHKLSRTFMVGLDDHEYSHDALSWLLDSMIEDGDIVVCVKVNEKDVKPSSEMSYQKEARELLAWTESQNVHNKGIHMVLEYSFGKLTQTFRGLIEVHQPGMLVVGTKGKAAQGIQGVWNSRNSFSKYCLQYSPVPVVVVRPKDKRIKKKEKRSNDVTRRGYRGMLESTGGVHEIDMDLDEMEKLMETSNTADEEAHHVARALGLPASFDPLIKGIDPNVVLRGRTSAANSRPSSSSGASLPSSLSNVSLKAGQSSNSESGPGQSRMSIVHTQTSEDDESDGVDSEMDAPRPASASIQNREKLHRMEVGEAAALKKTAWSDDDD
ncbi:Universal stress protein A family protein C25B2.10 [Ceratocystis lukuohia]|uniref:Universal stress protein A family protein C25B2.10 n=1 Tax=Ceratocystis lukuohia TaxID=2019550 RepID=A0ABR4MT16_9PEZI